MTLLKQRGCYWRDDEVVSDIRKRRRFRIGERVYLDGDMSCGYPVKDVSAVVVAFSKKYDVNRRKMVTVYLRQSKRLLNLSPDWLRRWR